MCRCEKCKTVYDPNDNYSCPTCGGVRAEGQEITTPIEEEFTILRRLQRVAETLERVNEDIRGEGMWGETCDACAEALQAVEGLVFELSGERAKLKEIQSDDDN